MADGGIDFDLKEIQTLHIDHALDVSRFINTTLTSIEANAYSTRKREEIKNNMESTMNRRYTKYIYIYIMILQQGRRVTPPNARDCRVELIT